MENMLAENIRRYRRSMGLTQDQLAERLGITLGAVSKWERGGSEPDLSYIMDLAGIFHVSVDALIGFTMRGTDADTEADRLDELEDRLSSGDPDERVSVWSIAAEYETALKKFPNSFRIVSGAAVIFKQIGVVYRKEAELKRSLDLFRHAIDLISQNRDPRISEVLIRDEIAGCYSALKDYKKAIEEYKKNNIANNNNARIGLLLTQYEKKPEEGIEYTERAFFGTLSGLVTTTAGYLAYFLSTSRYEEGIQAAEWTIRAFEHLKKDPDRCSYVDKIICLIWLDLALLQDLSGLEEASDESLRTAVRIARDFDANPVFSLDNLVLSVSPKTTSVYDDTGPTAMEGLVRNLEEDRRLVSDAFWKKLERMIGSSAAHPPVQDAPADPAEAESAQQPS